MACYEFFLVSALEKVFPGKRPQEMAPDAVLSAFPGSSAAVQLVYRADSGGNTMAWQPFDLTVCGADGCGIRLREVGLVPSDYPCYEVADDDYLTKEPGLFPDLLTPLAGARVVPLPRQYRSVWVTFDIPADARPGVREVALRADAVEGVMIPNGEVRQGERVSFTCRFRLRVAGKALPPQKLLHTEWFHADFLAAYYGAEVFSEEFWRIAGNFITEAGRHGINMLLTPVFTPPLDTAVGAERGTVQLVDVAREQGRYSFDFSKLGRWAALCREAGVEYIEIPHLFTQWGAHATPKIMAVEDGLYKRIFGWDVPATDPGYRAFLLQFIPALRAELERLGYDREHVYFHISDEPFSAHLDSYRAAKAQTEDLLEGCPVVDALSDFAFYQTGLVREPVPADNHIQPFLDANVENLWVYYCCVQGDGGVPNRFYSMPSYRNRVLGVLLYRYNIKGFLQWGYNFYGSKFSLRAVDPFRVTHADYGFPSGDAYLVYPGPGGAPLSSVRAEVQDDALYDLRALELLESLAGRPFVVRLIQDVVGGDLTFTEYPRNAEFLLRLRERVADEIESRV